MTKCYVYPTEMDEYNLKTKNDGGRFSIPLSVSEIEHYRMAKKDWERVQSSIRKKYWEAVEKARENGTIQVTWVNSVG